MRNKILAVLTISVLLLQGCTPKEIRVAERIQKSTVLVHIRLVKGDRTAMATCAGVVVSPHEILLANHCVASEYTDKVWIRDFAGRSQEAQIERQDPKIDLALLRVVKREIPAKIGHSVRVGQAVIVVGMPLGLEWVVTSGIVSRTDLEMPWFPKASFIIFDAVCLPGNSGGGIWNENGALIGIVSMSSSMLGSLGASGLGFAVDIDTVRGFIDK